MTSQGNAVAADAMVTWLRGQIEARKAAAQRAGGDQWAVGGPPGRMYSSRVKDSSGDVVVYDEGAPSEEEAAHIAENDPQDTIARCEAELAILAEHIHMNGGSCLICHYQVGPQFRPAPFPCRTVRLLASGYRHRDGFDERWLR